MRDKEPRRIKDNESISYLRFALLSLSINLIFLKLVEPWEREIYRNMVQILQDLILAQTFKPSLSRSRSLAFSLGERCVTSQGTAARETRIHHREKLQSAFKTD